MKTRTILAITLITLLAALTVYAQVGGVRANIPFAFTAGGKQFPAGQYNVAPDSKSQIVTVTSADGKTSAIVQVQTRMSAAIHNTPADAHLVFDKVGTASILSELWVPGSDAYMLNTTKEAHTHQVVDVPVR